MVLYRHRNTKNGIIAIFDSKNRCHVLKPGQECIIDMKREQSGVIVIEEIPELTDVNKEEKKQDVPETEQIFKKRKNIER